MGVKISEMAAKGSSDGTELLATSDSGTTKSITTANVKDYVVDQIEALALAASVTGSDELILNEGGTTLKTVDIDTVCQFLKVG